MNEYLITSEMVSTYRATLDHVQTIIGDSDAIDYQIIGKSKAMLMCVYSVNGVQNIDVSKFNIPRISMQICTPTGDSVPFLTGLRSAAYLCDENCY